MKKISFGIVSAVIATFSLVASAELTNRLAYDQSTIDECYFGSTYTPSGYTRHFENCQFDGESYVTDGVYHRRVQCIVEYDPTEIYKAKFKRNYTVEYQVRKNGSEYQIRVPMLSATRVMETPNISCSLTRWSKMREDN
ncbi:hypothetical protein UFOVP1290_194 [uncultured Caudovirales phage]|uniref:Uncharacterized protein n=1 Tax=uncultured Caudovirales phage TaxID=2100421 RepID=A0A6J5RXD8_9CAUD|nr:hypothetical protein UFOVP1290_194 [uncultured Caudovirales phage]